MSPADDQPQLPTSAELTDLARLAAKFAEEIGRPPYDLLTGAWSPSTLLPPDASARNEQPVPKRKRQNASLLGLLGEEEVDPERDRVRRVEQERRHRIALRARFLDQLAEDAAYARLHSLRPFRALLEAFTAESKHPKAPGPLRALDAEAQFINLAATELAWLQGAGRQSKSANKETSDGAAEMIDKLLALQASGLNPPLIGFVTSSSGMRLAFLSEELERWRDALRKPLAGGRKRRQKNDPHLGRRLALRSFMDSVERAFSSPRATAALGERFAELVGYKNPAAQASR